VGLAFAARHGARLNQLLVLAAAHRPNPLASAQRAVQRGIVRLGLQQGCVDQALSLARQLAMTTYRGHTELGKRFCGGAEWLGDRFKLPVEDWLEHAGQRFAARFDAQRYLDLSESIDLHDVDPASIHTHTTLIGFTSDRLVPLADLCELQQRLGHGATLEVIETIYGHDGFLKQCDAITPLLRAALKPSQPIESSISRRAS
ncbi:MAG: alpha/beta hydrolase, partial [Xanthomonadales bacterium]|nr:alpha/beta hydrolase [Xanthomonadales bacterium]